MQGRGLGGRKGVMEGEREFDILSKFSPSFHSIFKNLHSFNASPNAICP